MIVEIQALQRYRKPRRGHGCGCMTGLGSECQNSSLAHVTAFQYNLREKAISPCSAAAAGKEGPPNNLLSLQCVMPVCVGRGLGEHDGLVRCS